LLFTSWYAKWVVDTLPGNLGPSLAQLWPIFGPRYFTVNVLAMVLTTAFMANLICTSTAPIKSIPRFGSPLSQGYAQEAVQRGIENSCKVDQCCP